MISSQRNTAWATTSTASTHRTVPSISSVPKWLNRSFWLANADSLPVRITLLFCAIFICIALYLIDAIFGLWLYDIPGDEQTVELLRSLFYDVYIRRLITGLLLALGMVITCGVYLRHFTHRNMRPLLHFSQQIATQQTGDRKTRVALDEPLSGEFRKIGHSMQAMHNQLAAYEEQRIALLKRMTHDVRSPLTVIQTLASMQQSLTVQRRQHSAANAVADWQLVDACAVQLGRLLDDLGYLVGNHAGRAYHPNPASATEILPATEQLVRFHEARLRGRNVSFTITMMNGTTIGATDESKSGATNEAAYNYEPTAAERSLQIAMDFTRLSQLLGNLIDNAVDHGKATQIDLKLRTQGESIQLRISDNGCGMPEEVRKQIFDEGFSRCADKHAHQGLGLAIVSDIVSAHQGSIRVFNNPHGGTIFDLMLPLRK